MQDFYAKFDGDLFYTPMEVVARTCRSYEMAKYAPPSDAKKTVLMSDFYITMNINKL